MRPLYRTAALTFVADQITKLVVVHGFNLVSVGAIDVLPPYLNLRMAWNRGVNFGMFGSNSDFTRWALVALACAISIWVFVWIKREKVGRWGQISGGLLIGGALGNVLDRVIYGAVADFLNMSCCGIDNPYAFNVADIAIFVGAAGLILFTGGSARSGKNGA